MPQIKQKVSHREAKLQNWGNSKAVRLTRDILEEAGFNATDDAVFDVEIEPNRISLVRKSQLTPFQKLFVGYNGEKPEPEALWDEVAPVGKEEW
ncbi:MULTISPECIES: hypothetical protein [Planococcus]|uniref:AbrB/MazE/SpoVT family DNA-binding domain-containing protein n=1 Tax=Planococcus faecalis TaxID=1598147 RepID=A0ABM6IRN9_9BACL|nr:MULTISPECIES: hypothetical protein [Planococcus]AQU79277.1 hypothetical protein AJGP001_08365 [Planococcus faecalis]MDJ0333365.1 hypothetical protein [Planococcus sp. S3-L1]OHX52311.1 hypothetical protein BB777_12960 [Planococcus faecalis]